MDRIDYNVEQAAVKVEEGLEQLRKVSNIYDMPGINESRNVRYLWPWALLKNISDVVIFIPGTIWHFVLFWCILYMKQKTCHITSTKCNIEQQHLYDLG